MSGLSFGSAIGSDSVCQSRGAVNEILIVQIAKAKREFHARGVKILRGGVHCEKLFNGFMGFP
jgi:hypothetical protein